MTYTKHYFPINDISTKLATTAYINNLLRPIGRPIICLYNETLLSDEIWLEGAAVSRTTYANLFAKYGTTYGAGDGSTTFALPDFRNRALWGSNGYGYLAAGLPNIAGAVSKIYANNGSTASGALQITYSNKNTREWGEGCSVYTLNLNASKSNAIYGKSATVQPNAIKVRVKTRYK